MAGSFTESTLLDLVTEDGRSGFMVRIARHVDEGVGWVWAVAYGPGGVHGFVDDDLDCPRTPTVDDDTSAIYEVPLPSIGARAWIRRNGRADTVSGGACELEVPGHSTPDVPRGSGATRMRIEAVFATRARRAGSNLPGRTESIVDVEAVVTVDGVGHRLRGLGQFHEQLQDAPRFDTPFTYTSLRGADVSLVGLQGPRGGRAVVQRSDADPDTHLGFSIDPLRPSQRWSVRRLRIAAPDASAHLLDGELEPTVLYTVPIGRGIRPSTVVRGLIDGKPVTGFVNDWTP